MNFNNKLFYPIQLNWLQLIKFVVYFLLLINFCYYIIDDWAIAKHTLRDGGSILEWAAAFRTTIDESAWFILLLLFELETYALTDDALTPGRIKWMHGVRLVCFLFLSHTIYANSMAVVELSHETPLEQRVTLCDLTDKNISFTYNYAYTSVDANNCHELSSGGQLYSMDSGAVVTDQAGWDYEKYMSKFDLVESLSWIAVLLTIELIVRLQNKGMVVGRLFKVLSWVKIGFYGILWLAIANWIYYGHYVYAWDEFVWIAGFAAIELNVAEWRQELVEEGHSHHSPPHSTTA